MINKTVPRMSYHVRDLLDFDEDEIWDLPRPGIVALTYDDGQLIHTNTVDICFSWYLWQIVDSYRELQITPKLCTNGRPLTDKLYREMLWAAIEDTVDMDINKEDVWLLAYKRCYNELYVALSTRLLPYIDTISAPEVLEILNDEEITAANEAVTDAMPTIDNAYAVIKKVFNSGKYKNNPIVRAALNRTVPMPQILQSFGPKGLSTDIDSVMYVKPIRRGFAMGLGDTNSFAKETRSASKALLFNKDPVADAEYFNRKLQLVCSVLERVVKGDCGTRDAHEAMIPEGSAGEALIRSMAGLYQVLPSGKLHEILPTDTHLLGQRIRFRTTNCCQYLHEQEVCEVCYGKTSYALPHDTNPGHVSSTSLNKRFTQIIISTKHLDFIVHKFIVALRGTEGRYLAIKEGDKESLYLNSVLKGKSVKLRISAQEAAHLVDINYVKNLANMDISRASQLTSAEFYTVDENQVYQDQLQVNLVKQATKASLSTEMLRYLQTEKWIANGSSYWIDLANWDVKKPLFVYPLKHENMSEFASKAETLFRSARSASEHDETYTAETSKKTVKNKAAMLVSYRDVDDALMDAYYLISEKLDDIHLGHISTVIATSRVTDTRIGDCAMPNGLYSGVFRSHDEIIRRRSLSVAMLYQRQNEVFEDVTAYIDHDRCTSIMDSLVYIEPANARR